MTLSPLLFVIATYTVLVKMHELATCGQKVGMAHNCLTSSLHINTQKLVLISCIVSDLVDLGLCVQILD